MLSGETWSHRYRLPALILQSGKNLLGFYVGTTCQRWLIAVRGNAARWTALAAARMVALVGMAFFIPWVTKWSCWLRLPKRGFKTPQAAFLPFPTSRHPHEHVGLALHQTGQRTGQPATTDTSFKAATSWCLDKHLHQQTLPNLLVGSSSISQPFATSYPCSLKHNCTLPSSDLGQKILLLVAADIQGQESQLCTRIVGVPLFCSLLVQQGWYLLTQTGPYLPGLPTEGKHHPLVFSGSMAW